MMPRYSVPGLNVAGTGGGPGMRSNFDKFNTQDAVIDELRRFATEKGVNVILVIHPRKENEDQHLGMSSVFGTAKATQEADVVLIIQRMAAAAAAGQGQFRSGYAPRGVDGASAQGDEGGPTSPTMAIAVKKNRYSGELGKIDLGFNSAINCFYEISDADKEK